MEYSGKRENNLIENYVVIDLEMTGLNGKIDRILETGAVRVRDGRVTESYSALIRPGVQVPKKVTELTGITQEMADGGKDSDEAMAEFFAFLGEDVLVGQNIIFDYSFLKQWAVNHRYTFERKALDTLKLARKFLPGDQKKDLDSLCLKFGIARQNAHRALDDALETQQVFERIKEEFGSAEDAFVPQPLLYKAKKQSPATERQKEYLRRYAQHFGIALAQEPDSLTKSEASRLTDRLILRHGKLPR